MQKEKILSLISKVEKYAADGGDISMLEKPLRRIKLYLDYYEFAPDPWCDEVKRFVKQRRLK